MNNENSRPIPELMSHWTIRRAIGVIGMGLPIVLLIGTFIMRSRMMPSISHYFYTYMVTLFTGTLCAVGLFLICYKGFGAKDDRATNIAGFCAFGVALFPTSTIKPSIYNVDFWKYSWIVHYGFAIGFFITLAYISIKLFTYVKPGEVKSPDRIRQDRVYRTCGWLMIVFVILVPILSSINIIKPLNPTFFLEMLALWCFGISWLTKGKIHKKLSSLKAADIIKLQTQEE